ncbi:interferon-inducible GTPase-domain-containing protein [Apiospora hydei]|uniref:Interferon-inducible GTPase-domain-containing protein n=1 Tax=Apiospora hydei TaxID=1337664 RepID=A0ABR1X9X4_9PEZI
MEEWVIRSGIALLLAVAQNANQAAQLRAAARRAEEEAEEQRRQREEVAQRLAREQELRELGIQPDRDVSPQHIEQAKKDAGFINDHTHIVVTGNRGSGKSSLINALLGYAPKDSRAAPTGAIETTMERNRFVDHRHQGYIWYDVPGAGTANVTAWQYYYNQGLYIYDLVVVVHETTLSETDIRILKVCKLRNQPFVVVRSKSDLHIFNTQHDMDLNPRAAREHYIAAARQDNPGTVLFRDEVLDVADLLVSNRTVRAVINGDSPQGDLLQEPIDEVELLKRLGLLP